MGKGRVFGNWVPRCIPFKVFHFRKGLNVPHWSRLSPWSPTANWCLQNVTWTWVCLPPDPARSLKAWAPQLPCSCTTGQTLFPPGFCRCCSHHLPGSVFPPCPVGLTVLHLCVWAPGGQMLSLLCSPLHFQPAPTTYWTFCEYLQDDK